MSFTVSAFSVPATSSKQAGCEVSFSNVPIQPVLKKGGCGNSSDDAEDGCEDCMC